VTTQLQNTVIILDALADSRGVVLSAQEKTAYAEQFIDQVDGPASNEEKANGFNGQLARIINSTARSHVRIAVEDANNAVVDAEVDAAVAQL